VNQKLFQKILSGGSDYNIEFDAVCNLLINLGFKCRINGSHHIFWIDNIPSILNLQKDGNKTKGYQIKQIRNYFLKFNIGGLK